MGSKAFGQGSSPWLLVNGCNLDPLGSPDGKTKDQTSLLSTKDRKHHSNKLGLDNRLRRFKIHASCSLNDECVDRCALAVTNESKHEEIRL